ncbi:MAG: polysulfide reductase NrfD [Proteobacteria bacterium]|nr:polysulfide reductase NrfD [Pseudomonadota bacterium]MBU1419969.1 polysulfide reductase NrfD [Pseudomonadota bacterium]MBU1454485.1 polysulfide reductase NrfD [Pseudomonadota bacterium]
MSVAAHGDTAAAVANYIFPNDLHVHWSLMIVLYPYITGIVAGAFIVSSLYHVFHIKELKPISRFSLLFALAFLICATWPLLNHLGHPERAMSMMLTPNPTSAMAGFGYIYSAYMIVLLLEILFLYRPTVVALKEQASGFMRTVYGILSVGSDNVSEKALKLDHKIISFLAAIGIPMACVLHGYVGFIFGGIKANPLWATPLMPLIFLLSACVSGIAGIILAYTLIMKFTGQPLDVNCIRTCVKFLWGFFILDFVFEMLELFSHFYMATHHWHTLETLYSGPLYVSFWVLQVGVFSVIPFFVLMALSLINWNDKVIAFFAPLVSVMILCQVLLMRWNVVVGGQLMSKSERGATTFHPQWLEKEGILPAIIIMVAPLVILWILGKVLPFWQKDDPAAQQVG